MRRTIITLLLAAFSARAFAGPVSPSGCPDCIHNTGTPENAQINIGSATVRGTIAATTGTFTYLNGLNLKVVGISGSGALITNLNASQLLSGLVSTSVVAGNYQGITGVGLVSSGTWKGTPVGTQYGGTGQNFVAVGQGSLPHFTATGVMGTLSPGSAGSLLQTNGAGMNPSWTLTPSVLGTNVTGIPLANIIPGELPAGFSVNDFSISTVAAVKVIGNISGGASFLTVPLPIANLGSGTLPTSNAASSITATGVVPGVVGGPYLIPQINIHDDGRIYTSTQMLAALQPFQISAGVLPGNVTVDPRQISTGTLPSTVVASSVANSGVIAGVYGGANKLVQFTVTADGRLVAASSSTITIVSTSTVFQDVDNNFTHSQTFQASVTVNASVLASSFTGYGGGLTHLTAANIDAGSLGPNVIASSLAANGAVAGTYGDGTTVPRFTLGGDGRILAVTSATITVAASSVAASGVQPGTLSTGVFLNAGSLVNGPVASSILPSTVAYTSVANVFTAAQSIAGFGLTATSATLTASGANQFSLATSSGINVGAGPLFLNSGGYIRFGDGTVQLTASTGTGGGGSITAGSTTTWTASNAFTAPVTIFSSLTVTGAIGAASFTGNGAGLTNVTASSVNAANIQPGILGATVVASSVAATGVTAGTYGSATQAPQITVNGDGRASTITNVTITPAAASITAGTLGATVIASSVAASGVVAGAYGDATHVAVFTVGGDGRLTAASSALIASSGGGTSIGLKTDVFTAQANGVTTTFNLSTNVSISSAVWVYLDGLAQTYNVDYTFTPPTTITFTTAPAANSNSLVALYSIDVASGSQAAVLVATQTFSGGITFAQLIKLSSGAFTGGVLTASADGTAYWAPVASVPSILGSTQTFSGTNTFTQTTIFKGQIIDSRGDVLADSAWQSKMFTSAGSGSFTSPAQSSMVYITMCGGGGGGGGNNGGGGGSGAMVYHQPVYIGHSASVSYTVAAGGVGGVATTGGNGGTSTITFTPLSGPSITWRAVGGIGGGPPYIGTNQGKGGGLQNCGGAGGGPGDPEGKISTVTFQGYYCGSGGGYGVGGLGVGGGFITGTTGGTASADGGGGGASFFSNGGNAGAPPTAGTLCSGGGGQSSGAGNGAAGGDGTIVFEWIGVP